MPANPLRILLVDDHAMVRAGIRALLSTIDGVEVADEAGDADEALAMALALRPDIVLTDISMKGRNGLMLAEQIRAELPQTRVIVLSMHADDSYVQQALRIGIAGYILKDAAATELAAALRAVAAGGNYLSPSVSRQVMEGFGKQLQSGMASPLAALSPRQREILKLIASGRSTKQIAFDLKLSVKTVETHRAHLMERLGLKDLAGLVRFAIREGLVSADD
jgi:DNA-binding NarL/FixJ family response regulator